MKKLECNQDLVNDLLTYSKCGPLGEVFVMHAIREYARIVIMKPPAPAGESVGIDSGAWRAVALDVAERCDAFYNRHAAS